MYDLGLGTIIYKIDQELVDLGMEGSEAYARDENGEFIVEARGPRNAKMLGYILELQRPEIWGRPRKRKTSGVVVIGERSNNCAPSIKARHWKYASRRIGEQTKA